jgi:hypothetical protein
LSSDIIHNSQAKVQSIYTLKINNSLLLAYFLCTVNALIFSASKEGIIHSSITSMDSSFLHLLTILGVFGTIFYASLLIFEIFSFSFFSPSSYSLFHNASLRSLRSSLFSSFIAPFIASSSYSLLSLFLLSGYPTCTLFLFSSSTFLLSSSLHCLFNLSLFPF